MNMQAAIYVAKKKEGQVWCRRSKDWIVTFYDKLNFAYYMVGDGRNEYVGNIGQFESMYPTAWLYKDFSSLNMPPHPFFRR